MRLPAALTLSHAQEAIISQERRHHLLARIQRHHSQRGRSRAEDSAGVGDSTAAPSPWLGTLRAEAGQ